MRVEPGTVSVDRGRTKVAHRVERGESDWGTKEGGLEWGSCGRARDGWRTKGDLGSCE